LSEVALVLKTPTAQLGSNGAAQHPEKRKAGGHGPTLDDEVTFLLPDPDGIRRDGRDESPNSSHSPAEWWGDYLAAIRRQELMTNAPAPAPTETGPRGGRRLTAQFAEWLMGLPSGWVTSVPGLKRSEQLKAIGNGVMPQQAYAAYAALLDRIEEREA
jgi:site-specific DNA-cytosine methylase